MEKKLVATDLDGTLLSDEIERDPQGNFVKVRKISQTNAEAIAELQAIEDVIVVPVTSRHPKNVRRLLEAANLRCPIIGASGAQILNHDGEIIFERNIEKQHLASVMKILNEQDVDYFLLQSDGGWLYRQSTTEGERRGGQRKPRLIDGQIDDVDQNILQVMAYTQSPKKKQALMEAIRGEFPFLSVSSSNNQNIEIGPKEAKKGQGICFLAKHEGIALWNCYVFGDNHNDISMFEVVKKAGGRSYAMPGSPEELFAVATHRVQYPKHGVGMEMMKLARRWRMEAALKKTVQTTTPDFAKVLRSHHVRETGKRLNHL